MAVPTGLATPQIGPDACFTSKGSNGHRCLLDLHGRSQSPALVGTDNKRTASQMSEARSEVGGISSLRFGYDV